MGIVHRSLSFINGVVIGTIIGAALLVQISGPTVELLTIAKMAGVGAIVGSIFAGFKWLAGISGGIMGGLIAVVFVFLGSPSILGLDEWIIKYVLVAIIVPLLPTVGVS